MCIRDRTNAAWQCTYGYVYTEVQKVEKNFYGNDNLKGYDLAFVGYDGKWILEKGDFRIQTGDQTVNVVCTDTKKWETDVYKRQGHIWRNWRIYLTEFAPKLFK